MDHVTASKWYQRAAAQQNVPVSEAPSGWRQRDSTDFFAFPQARKRLNELKANKAGSAAKRVAPSRKNAKQDESDCVIM